MSASVGKIDGAPRELWRATALPPGDARAREESGERAAPAGPSALGNTRG